jgi:hypothetical protein
MAHRFALVFVICAFMAHATAAADIVRTGGPYVPTPQEVVDEMLAIADVTMDDFVIDLGSGDGRIVLSAASYYRARGQGIDIDPELVAQSNREAKRRGLDELVSFQSQDALKARIDQASVLTLYLLPQLMNMLRDRIYHELKPGARVVSHDFRFNDWLPDRSVTIDVAEKYGSLGAWQSTVNMWVVPAKIAGRWQMRVAQSPSVPLSFSQQFQHISGEALWGESSVVLQDARLEGGRIAFTVPGVFQGAAGHFTGTVEGDTMRGTVTTLAGSAEWRAVRIEKAAPVPAAQ